MRSRFGPWLLAFALLTAAAPALRAQDEGISQKKQEKILAKKAKTEKKEKVKKEKTDRKHHLSIQDKDTRKRLKRHTKRADRRGSGLHRDGWLRRLFTKE